MILLLRIPLLFFGLRRLCVPGPVEQLQFPPHGLDILWSEVEVVRLSLDLLPRMHVIYLLISIAKSGKAFELFLIVLSRRLFSVARLLKLAEVVLR